MSPSDPRSGRQLSAPNPHGPNGPETRSTAEGFTNFPSNRVWSRLRSVQFKIICPSFMHTLKLTLCETNLPVTSGEFSLSYYIQGREKPN